MRDPSSVCASVYHLEHGGKTQTAQNSRNIASPPPLPDCPDWGGGARDVSGPLRGRVTLCGGQRGVGSVVRGGRLRVALSPPRPRTEQMAGEASGRVSCCYLSLMTRSVNFVGNTPSCLCMPPALITVIEL